VLFVVAIPGVFTIDENNHIAAVIGLRHGDFALPGTAGLTPSPELFWFEPWVGGRGKLTTPAVSTIPPLYSVIALPFSVFGLRGLISLNIAAFLFSVLLVFRIATHLATHSETPWIAAFVFFLGAYNVDYALGIWPHMVSVFFCLLAVDRICAHRESPELTSAAIAGACAGVAAGIRYQNVIFAVLLACTILFWGKRRAAKVASFALGVAVPLAMSATLNRFRLGWWNPFTKGPAYTSMPRPSANGVVEAAHVFWAKVVDFSVHPPISASTSGVWRPDNYGAFIAFGGVKKALLQSCPWLLLAFAVLVSAWAWKVWEPKIRSELKAFSIIAAGIIAFFCIAGFGRHDGVSFNQRYFLELVPLTAISLALVFELAAFKRTAWAAGLLLGLALAAGAGLGEPGSGFRSLILLKLPLLISLGALIAVAMLIRRNASHAAISFAVGCCVAWAATVHLTDDLRATRRYRDYTRKQYELFKSNIPNLSALVTQRVTRDSAGPLILDRDVVIVDASIDDGASLKNLIDELHGQGRKVFVDTADFPADLLTRIQRSKELAVVVPGKQPIIELR
jgi:hypothetical protein